MAPKPLSPTSLTSPIPTDYAESQFWCAKDTGDLSNSPVSLKVFSQILFDTEFKFYVIFFLTLLLLCHLDHISYRGQAILFQEMNHQYGGAHPLNPSTQEAKARPGCSWDPVSTPSLSHIGCWENNVRFSLDVKSVFLDLALKELHHICHWRPTHATAHSWRTATSKDRAAVVQNVNFTFIREDNTCSNKWGKGLRRVCRGCRSWIFYEAELWLQVIISSTGL